MRKLLFLLMIISFVLPVVAQDEAIEPETVMVAATDDLMLAGDMYRPDVEDDAPAVLLIHMLGGRRAEFTALIPALVDAGYIVVNVDMRGHGETGGSQDWELAEADVQVWLDWIRGQDSVRTDAVSIIGGSIGSNLALIGCANDEACLTVIALSPGTDYRGVMPYDAVTEGLANRSALLLASHSDRFSAESVREMFINATGDISARLYEGRAHGTQFFNSDLDSITALILSWLDEQVAAIEV